MEYFYNFNSPQEEQKTFMSLLYHDSRNGQIIRFQKNNEKIRQFSTFDLDELEYTGTDFNTYVTINTFRGMRRKTDKLFNKLCMYIDLDCHGYDTEAELETAKKKTAHMLEKFYKNGELAAPTMITSTGRGFGLFYVLDRSIANTPAARNSMTLFSNTYILLIRKYKDLLSTCEVSDMEVDTKVTDAARVARLPGTVNLKNGKICHLISVNHNEDGSPLYYGLRSIINRNNLDITSEFNRQDKKHVAAKVITFNPKLGSLLSVRVNRMRKLQELRGPACVDCCRETMCFIMYSALVQAYGHDTAVGLLRDYNDSFTDPLPDSEIEHIIEETDSHTVPEGKYAGATGFYPYSDYSIIKTLDITDEEIKAIGFGRSWERQKIKEDNQSKRKARDERIAKSIISSPQKSYKVIAMEEGVSKRTVERVAQIYGVGRYKKSSAENIATDGSADGEAVLVTASGDSASASRTDKKSSESFGVGGIKKFFDLHSSLPSARRSHLAVPLLSSLLSEVASLGSSDPSFLSSCIDYVDGQLIDFEKLPTHRVSSVALSIATGLAKRLVDYDCTHGRFVDSRKIKKPKKSKRSVKKAQVPSDIRFELLERDPEFQRRLDPAVLSMVKGVFEIISSYKSPTFLVNGRKILTTDLQEAFSSLTYRDISVVTERISQRTPNPKVPLYYVSKVVWCYRHPEDNNKNSIIKTIANTTYEGHNCNFRTVSDERTEFISYFDSWLNNGKGGIFSDYSIKENSGKTEPRLNQGSSKNKRADIMADLQCWLKSRRERSYKL